MKKEITKERLLAIHKDNAVAIYEIKMKLWDLFFEYQSKYGKTKAEKIYGFRYIDKRIVKIQSKCDDLLFITNPELDNSYLNWYYGRFYRKRKNKIKRGIE